MNKKNLIKRKIYYYLFLQMKQVYDEMIRANIV